MMRRLAAFLILAPLTVLIVMFAVANRRDVLLAFDPFDPANPAFAVTIPLFALIFVLVGCGVLIGGTASWLRQHKWRARARRAEADNRALRRRLEERGRLPVPASRATSPVILPPAA